jgi:predicted dehydrogenase
LRIGIIGFGSIGKRYCENLIKLGFSDITLLRTQNRKNKFGLDEVYNEKDFFTIAFDFIILSNPTSLHFEYLEKLLPKQYNLLVEKPIVATTREFLSLVNMLHDYKALGMCAYNLRFHPCVCKVSELLGTNYLGKIYSARFFVGQYLPEWRPQTDYRESYSAKSSLGGGVVLDLIHEIDLASFLCGNVKNNFHALVGRLSALEIETEDIAEIHYQSENDTMVSIHLDYLTRGYTRYFELICENGKILCDLFVAEVKITSDQKNIPDVFTFKEFTRNDMYISLIEYYIGCVKSQTQPKPTLSDGLSSLITALSAKSFWKNNEKSIN